MKTTTTTTTTIVIALVAALGVGLSLFFSNKLEDFVVRRVVDEHVEHVNAHASTYISSEDWLGWHDPKSAKRFQEFLHVLQSLPDVRRINIVSNDSTLIFSTSPEKIGQKLLEEEIKEALEGKLVYKSVSEEESSEIGLENLLKIYIPVSFDRNTTPGVVEVYLDHSALALFQKELRWWVWGSTFAAIAVVAALLFVTFQRQNKLLMRQTRELQEERAQFLASINSLSLGFILVNKAEQIILHNSTAELMLELKEQEFNSQNVAERLKNAFDLRARCAECMAKGISVDQRDIPFKNKFLRIFMTPVTLLKDHKEIIGAVILVEDITEHKILERSRDEFFAVASHELRTPLTAIRGNMALLREFFGVEIKNHEAQEMVDDSYNASVRLIGIVNDFLDASRLEQGQVAFKKERIELAGLLEEVLRELGGLAASKKLKLIFKNGETAKYFVLADKDRTKQVAYNLLSNAINYTQKGGVRVEIKTENNMVKVFVEDTGMGISAENHALLFRKFQQAGERILARDVTKGTGLGLYISKLIIEAMGGKIWLERSEAGNGSVFAFALPLAS